MKLILELRYKNNLNYIGIKLYILIMPTEQHMKTGNMRLYLDEELWDYRLE